MFCNAMYTGTRHQLHSLFTTALLLIFADIIRATLTNMTSDSLSLTQVKNGKRLKSLGENALSHSSCTPSVYERSTPVLSAILNE